MVTSTTHKTLGGPRGGFILTNETDIAKKLNSAVFPGQQGGPLEHVIAGKAVAFKMAARPDFVERQRRCLDGAKILAERLGQPDVRDAGSRYSLAVPTCIWCLSTCVTRTSTVGRRRIGWRRSGSPSTATQSRSILARRW